MPNQITRKVFMFTGTLSTPRHEAQRIVEELGGIAGSSITKETNYLVCGSDQAGKSSKWEKAGLLGVTRVDEDYFWNLVKEARVEAESEEDWSNVKGWMTEETFVNVLELLEEKVRPKTVERVYPPKNVMTYHSSQKRVEWLAQGGYTPKLGSRICPHCSYEIPYSIDSTYYYCFKCHLFSDVGQEEGRHACVDWEKFLDSTSGWFEKCKLCGNVKFVSKEEVDADIDVKCNYVHSLEFAAEVASKYAGIDRNVDITASMSNEERRYWWSRFEKWQRKQEAKEV